MYAGQPVPLANILPSLSPLKIVTQFLQESVAPAHELCLRLLQSLQSLPDSPGSSILTLSVELSIQALHGHRIHHDIACLYPAGGHCDEVLVSHPIQPIPSQGISRCSRDVLIRYACGLQGFQGFERPPTDSKGRPAPPMSYRLPTNIGCLETRLTPSRYPEELADRTWDNVGLLLENTEPPFYNGAPQIVPSRVLLTNDLTIRVAQEAIRKQASVIVTYRTSPLALCPSWLD